MDQQHARKGAERLDKCSPNDRRASARPRPPFPLHPAVTNRPSARGLRFAPGLGPARRATPASTKGGRGRPLRSPPCRSPIGPLYRRPSWTTWGADDRWGERVAGYRRPVAPTRHAARLPAAERARLDADPDGPRQNRSATLARGQCALALRWRNRSGSPASPRVSGFRPLRAKRFAGVAGCVRLPGARGARSGRAPSDSPRCGVQPIGRPGGRPPKTSARAGNAWRLPIFRRRGHTRRHELAGTQRAPDPRRARRN